ncbi:hypothetical protein DH09_11620 [Bacillaceae bacterium JMAK1]|nr:hypothetical protein DH09_11620 [Bacillaceae bacterium JMAK1]
MNVRKIIIILIIGGLLMLQSPIILLANRIEPVILGLPFFIFWNFLWWAILTLVMYIAYKLNWGNHKTE